MIQNPSLAQVIADALEVRLTDVHVCMPGQIVSYNSSKALAVVQPCMKRKYQDGTVVAVPQIANVPVAFPRANNAFIHLPLKAGDYVTLVFAERCLDQWISNGGIVDPADPRKHHFSDAIAIPGAYPTTSPVTIPNSNDLVLANSQATMQLQAGGKFLFKGASDELMDLLVQLVDTLTQVQTTTMMGPQPFLPTYVTTLSTLKTKLQGLKGS